MISSEISIRFQYILYFVKTSAAIYEIQIQTISFLAIGFKLMTLHRSHGCVWYAHANDKFSTYNVCILVLVLYSLAMRMPQWQNCQKNFVICKLYSTLQFIAFLYVAPLFTYTQLPYLIQNMHVLTTINGTLMCAYLC